MKNKNKLFIVPAVAPLVFIICTFICMSIYSGGTKFNNAAKGYTFLDNFFSDLGRTVAWSGEKNYLSSAIFCFACSFVAINLVLYFTLTMSYFHKTNSTYIYVKIGAISGIISAMHFLGVGLTPGDLLRDLHYYCVFVAFGAIIVTGACYVPVVYNNNGLDNIYGHALVVFLVATTIYFLIISIGPGLNTSEGFHFQVVSQKIIIYIMMLNMSLQAYAMYRFAKVKDKLRAKSWLQD